MKHIPLARHRAERQITGRLENAVNDQFEQFRQRLAIQPQRRAFVKLQNQRNAIDIETLPMPDPFISPEARHRAIEWVKRELFALHPYNFTPDFRPDAEDARLRDFLDNSEENHRREADVEGEQDRQVSRDAGPLL